MVKSQVTANPAGKVSPAQTGKIGAAVADRMNGREQQDEYNNLLRGGKAIE